jgi:hypothetical protein
LSLTGFADLLHVTVNLQLALQNIKPVPRKSIVLSVCFACLMQAEARQRQFEQSAVGRAAIKSVKEAKRQDERPAANNTARDWLS